MGVGVLIIEILLMRYGPHLDQMSNKPFTVWNGICKSIEQCYLNSYISK